MNKSVNKKLIYENCVVYHPSGQMMFRCNKKKINWYLNRGIAEKISDNPTSIKLLFTPKGNGYAESQDFGTETIDNVCVNCGTHDDLTRHHVVPKLYRKHLPEEYKSHKFHDIVALCIECHSKYEQKAEELKMYLADKYEAPFKYNKNVLKMSVFKYRNILKNKNIPPEIKKKLINKYSDIFQKYGLNKYDVINMKSFDEVKHGEKVVKSVPEIDEFLYMWRKHFLDNMDCKYLPKNWIKLYLKNGKI